MLELLSRRPVKRGIEAGVIASVPQVLLAKAEEWLLMPPGEDAERQRSTGSRCSARTPGPCCSRWDRARLRW